MLRGCAPNYVCLPGPLANGVHLSVVIDLTAMPRYTIMIDSCAISNRRGLIIVNNRATGHSNIRSSAAFSRSVQYACSQRMNAREAPRRVLINYSYEHEHPRCRATSVIGAATLNVPPCDLWVGWGDLPSREGDRGPGVWAVVHGVWQRLMHA